MDLHKIYLHIYIELEEQDDVIRLENPSCFSITESFKNSSKSKKILKLNLSNMRWRMMVAVTALKFSFRKETGMKTSQKETSATTDQMIRTSTTNKATINLQVAQLRDLSCIYQDFQIMLSKVILRNSAPKLAANL